ncbi:MAG: hypothetical protein A2177_04370 [Spirochaetes bacterium RBG_13_68_11]|nr:MAG: hypothetical protein A2177_04370 [Spirochaetes bacterium RBG_13_68_11]
MKNDVATYPVTLKFDLPGKELNRLTTAFRIFLLVPIAIVIGLAAGGVLFLPALLMIVFRQKYPRWWFDWNVQFVRFGLRVAVYAALLTDVYPSTDEEQAVHLKVPYPDAKKDLSQWLPLVKWFLAIPHFVVLFFLAVAAWVCVVISWFAILFTGHYPKELATFVAGVMRWGVRVCAYAFLLVTDVYPPFTLD